MTRHDCGGGLTINFVNENVVDTDGSTGPAPWVAYIRFCHKGTHEGYRNVGLTTDQRKYIDENPDLLPAALCSNLRRRGATSELKHNAVYSYWFAHKQRTWRHDKDQIQSMVKVLAEAQDVEVVSMAEIEGIEAYAFMCSSLMDDVKQIGPIDEVLTDATYSTNAKNLELFSMMAPVDGVGFPLGYLLLTSTQKLAPRAKTKALTNWYQLFRDQGIIPSVFLCDKDFTEIAAARAVWGDKLLIFLCFWHFTSAIKKRLRQNGAPRAYDAKTVHQVFEFISPDFVADKSGAVDEDTALVEAADAGLFDDGVPEGIIQGASSDVQEEVLSGDVGNETTGIEGEGIAKEGGKDPKDFEMPVGAGPSIRVVWKFGGVVVSPSRVPCPPSNAATINLGTPILTMPSFLPPERPASTTEPPPNPSAPSSNRGTDMAGPPQRLVLGDKTNQAVGKGLSTEELKLRSEEDQAVKEMMDQREQAIKEAKKAVSGSQAKTSAASAVRKVWTPKIEALKAENKMNRKAREVREQQKNPKPKGKGQARHSAPTSSGTRVAFCAPEHHTTIISLMCKHFCQHPSFPTKDGSTNTSQEIYRAAIKEMYQFCTQHKLNNLWAYLWNSWYKPTVWKLWARSTASDYIPIHRTTMIVERAWHTLKHTYLHNHARPRLDLLIHIIVTQVLPDYHNKLVQMLETARHLSVAYWRGELRGELQRKSANLPRSHNHMVDLDSFSCSCRTFMISPYLICPHITFIIGLSLTRLGTPALPENFHLQVRRRTTPPIWQHPHLDRIYDLLGTIAELVSARRIAFTDLCMHIAKCIPDKGGSAEGEEEWDDYDQRENGLRNEGETYEEDQIGSMTAPDTAPDVLLPFNPSAPPPPSPKVPSVEQYPFPIDPALLEPTTSQAAVTIEAPQTSAPHIHSPTAHPQSPVTAVIRESTAAVDLGVVSLVTDSVGVTIGGDEEDHLLQMEEDSEESARTWDETIDELTKITEYLRRQKKLGADSRLAQLFRDRVGISRGTELLEAARKRDLQQVYRANQGKSVLETFSQHDPENRLKRRRTLSP